MDTSGRSNPRASGCKFTKRHLQAFSLVEVTIAIGIVAFAFIGLFGLIPTGLNTFRKAIDTSVGSQIAQRVINEAQQTEFSVLTSGSAASLRYFDDQGNEVATSTNAIYEVNTFVVPVTPVLYATGTTNSNGNIATVTVQIVNNPAHLNISSGSSTNLWNDNRFSILTYSGLVSRNQ